MNESLTTEDFVTLRRHIHAHPELAFQENDTAQIVADTLRRLGWSVVEGVGGTGVVGSLSRGKNPASIGIRADLDALPIDESGDVPHRSVHKGKMHGCGHDGHTAMLLAGAKKIAESCKWSGTVHAIFQPAEEIGVNSGAERMIAEGLFERFPCDAVFGMHNHPGLAVGTFMTRGGAFMSASDKVNIVVHGKGGHAARPHLCVDASLVVAAIVVALQSIVSRNVDPAETAVVSVGTMRAGTAYNVVPETAELELSVRSFEPRIRDLLRSRICAVAEAQALSYGATVSIDYVLGYPVLSNHACETATALQAARDVAGETAVSSDAPRIMGSEDFAYMLEARPGCLVRIGNGVNSAALHNPRYDFNDANIPVGAAFWAALVHRFFNSSTPPKGNA